jgi:hypothetical protein
MGSVIVLAKNGLDTAGLEYYRKLALKSLRDRLQLIAYQAVMEGRDRTTSESR